MTLSCTPASTKIPATFLDKVQYPEKTCKFHAYYKNGSSKLLHTNAGLSEGCLPDFHYAVYGDQVVYSSTDESPDLNIMLYSAAKDTEIAITDIGTDRTKLIQFLNDKYIALLIVDDTGEKDEGLLVYDFANIWDDYPNNLISNTICPKDHEQRERVADLGKSGSFKRVTLKGDQIMLYRNASDKTAARTLPLDSLKSLESFSH
jgi:hypothetical protein